MFFNIERWNFQHLFDNRILWNLTKFQLIQLIQTIFISTFSISCPIELKFCEASRNYFSNRWWKFQISILKNKKDLFLEKYEISQEWTGFDIKTTSFIYCPNFQQCFCFLKTSFKFLIFFMGSLDSTNFPMESEWAKQFHFKLRAYLIQEKFFFWKN